jgi:hypothetical protein
MRQVIFVDPRGRSSLGKLGFTKGSAVVADPVEGEALAWIIRPGRIMTDVETSIASNPDNVPSLQRAGAEAIAGAETIDLK